MTVQTSVKIGPTDHGRPMTFDDFVMARGQEGYRYELIEGRVYVSAAPNVPQNLNEEWLNDQLRDYRRRHPEVINYVTTKARVFVPGHHDLTNPEPDLAAYHNFPLRTRFRELTWRVLSPLLVVEVVSEDDPAKDLVRNVDLYRQVPSIREFWIVDPREDPDAPTMRIYRRRGRGWQKPIDLAAGETYTTPILPGFALLIDPHAD
jgi:Uma2 family endonuclease